MKSRYYALGCTQDHGEGVQCSGVLFGHSERGEVIPIYMSKALAQIAITEMHQPDGSQPEVVEIEVNVIKHG